MNVQGKAQFTGWALAFMWGMSTFANALSFGMLLQNPPQDISSNRVILNAVIWGTAALLSLVNVIFALRFQARRAGSRAYAYVSFGWLLVLLAMLAYAATDTRGNQAGQIFGIVMLSPWLALHGAAVYLAWKYPNEIP